MYAMAGYWMSGQLLGRTRWNMNTCRWEGIETDNAWGWVVPLLCVAVPAFSLCVGVSKDPPISEELLWYCNFQLFLHAWG